jgi:endo-1,4-beta-xylanase
MTLDGYDFRSALRYILLSLMCVLAAGCGGGGGSPAPAEQADDTDDPDAPEDPENPGIEKFFGTAPGDAGDYTDLLNYFSQLTPENASKWGSVEAARDVMDWTDLDTAYHFARDNNINFKFHTLIWGQQQPPWIDALSPEEQLEEIEEWMSEVAARYPDLEMIDVVNEPLHAPPAYAAALGGAGETGWDWVIRSFELAREHFPNSQLILNDYQILHLPASTLDYLEIITLLRERGLIDAIGEQGHFLEQTQSSMVLTNLNSLAAADLPIYITELDLNFADDVQHANKMRDLFTVFWEHPAVAGVTHWGHRQGSIWRTDAYLLRSDGSERPALAWLVCYLEGGGDDCDVHVPEYVPAGWQGDASGLTLEAELYDDAEGLVAIGGVVAYTNPGHWITFSNVEFKGEWDKLWVTYAKGNDTDLANITLHFGSLENPAVLTVHLPYTGGWNTFNTIQLDWSSLATTEDLYIRFNDDPAAVANLDKLHFGKL